MLFEQRVRTARMGRPQQPELYRSGETALEPDSVESELAAHPRPRARGRAGKVPPDNRPGHRPQRDQDQPDREAVARRLGIGRRTKRQLYDEARRRGIRGRSKMTKAELERAVGASSS